MSADAKDAEDKPDKGGRAAGMPDGAQVEEVCSGVYRFVGIQKGGQLSGTCAYANGDTFVGIWLHRQEREGVNYSRPGHFGVFEKPDTGGYKVAYKSPELYNDLSVRPGCVARYNDGEVEWAGPLDRDFLPFGRGKLLLRPEPGSVADVVDGTFVAALNKGKGVLFKEGKVWKDAGGSLRGEPGTTRYCGNFRNGAVTDSDMSPASWVRSGNGIEECVDEVGRFLTVRQGGWKDGVLHGVGSKTMLVWDDSKSLWVRMESFSGEFRNDKYHDGVQKKYHHSTCNPREDKVVSEYYGTFNEYEDYDGCSTHIMHAANNQTTKSVGTWCKGQLEGSGVVTTTAACGKVVMMHYVGEFSKGDFHGLGKLTMRHENSLTHLLPSYRHVGEFREGLREGNGTTIYDPDNVATTLQSCSGGWVRDKLDGEGKQVWKNGDSYEGQHLRGMRNGTGTMKCAKTNTVYFGNWRHDKKHDPEGKLTYSNGDVLVACYEDDVCHGPATFTSAAEGCVSAQNYVKGILQPTSRKRALQEMQEELDEWAHKMGDTAYARLCRRAQVVFQSTAERPSSLPPHDASDSEHESDEGIVDGVTEADHSEPEADDQVADVEAHEDSAREDSPIDVVQRDEFLAHSVYTASDAAYDVWEAVATATRVERRANEMLSTQRQRTLENARAEEASRIGS